MKTVLFLVLALLAIHVSSIPYKQQISLLNSLEVGREEEPLTWACVGCDSTNKPLSSHVIKEDNQEIRAIVSVYDEYTVLAFRYTANVKNVWQDLLWAIQVQEEHAPSGCKVQKQYENMWNSIRKEVQQDLLASSHTGRLIITGISLGGGLAMISYADIQKWSIFENIEIITFGAPRVGNKNWANWMEAMVEPDPVHICLKGDPICVMPRCLTPICNYKHTGTGYSCDKSTQTCSPTGKVNAEWATTEMDAFVSNIIEAYTEEKNENEVGGIISGLVDHIQNYKTLKTFAWVDSN